MKILVSGQTGKFVFCTQDIVRAEIYQVFNISHAVDNKKVLLFKSIACSHKFFPHNLT